VAASLTIALCLPRDGAGGVIALKAEFDG